MHICTNDGTVTSDDCVIHFYCHIMILFNVVSCVHIFYIHFYCPCSLVAVAETQGFDSHAGRQFYLPKLEGGITSATFCFGFIVSPDSLRKKMWNRFPKNPSGWQIELNYDIFCKNGQNRQNVETLHNWEQKLTIGLISPTAVWVESRDINLLWTWELGQNFAWFIFRWIHH